MTTDGQDGGTMLVLTADEISAIAQLLPPGFPPGVGPGDPDQMLADAGLRSLVARSLLSDDGAVAPELAIVLATYHSATHRANVVAADATGERQSTLHVGPELGVTHLGRPGGVHSFALVEPAVWSTDALADMILGDHPAADAVGEPSADPIAAASRSAITSVVVREGASYSGVELAVAWTDEGAWIVGTDGVTPATKANVVSRLGDLQQLESAP